VGVDQLPHLELTREIIRRFNTLYKEEVFPEPEPILTKTPKLLGLDNRKMSKSYGNFIGLGDAECDIEKRVGQMITDTARIRLKDPGHPDICNVFSYYAIFSTPQTQAKVKECCERSTIGCTECKKNLAGILAEHLEPIRDRRNKLTDSHIEDVLRSGAKRARQAAAETMDSVKRLVNFFV
jgi:tryptophanyl-tRNA synthetase